MRFGVLQERSDSEDAFSSDLFWIEVILRAAYGFSHDCIPGSIQQEVLGSHVSKMLSS
jgi:hypothetical protein